MENKNPTIDTVKGMVIVLVVCGHVIQRTMFPNGEDFFSNPAFKIIYTFHMPLFVFISGYLMAFSLKRRGVADAFKARCRSLLVPFLSWSILGILTNYFLNIIDGKNIGISHLPQDLADQLLLNPVIWFLLTLFMVSAILLCSIGLGKRFGPAAFVVVYGILMIIPPGNFCSFYFIKWFYLFYAAGYFINRCEIKITNSIANIAILLGSLILFAVFLPYWTTNDYIYINKMNFGSNQYLDEILRIIYRYAIGFLGIIITFYVGMYFSKIKMEHFWGAIGIYSLDIYLIQRYIVEGIYPRFVHAAHINFDFNSPAFLCVYVPLAAIFFVGVCILVSKLLIRKNDLLNRLLLGGRN